MSTKSQEHLHIKSRRQDSADSGIPEELQVESLYSNASLSTGVDKEDSIALGKAVSSRGDKKEELVRRDTATGSLDAELLNSKVH